MARHPSHPVALWLLIVVALAASATFVGWRLLGHSDGGVISFYGDAWTVDGVHVDRLEPGEGGLHSGDLITAIEGRSFNAWLDDAVNPASWVSTTPGQSLFYSVQRGGAPLDVVVELRPRDVSGYLLENWGNVLFAVVLLGLGLYVLWRRPELPAARALALAATAAGGSMLPWMLGLYSSDVFLGWPYVFYVATVSALYMLLWPAGTLHLPLALMARAGNGHAPSRRVMAAIYAVPLGAYAGAVTISRLTAPSASAWVATWPTLQGMVVVPCILAGVTLAVIAYRRATTDARRQLRWALVGASGATLVAMAAMYIPQLVLGRPLVSWSVIGLIALPLPVGLAVAIVRHRLFDIDVVVNRTLVYGGVTVAILTIYALTVLVLGAVVPQGAGFAASLVATGLAAIAALPARDVLQRYVNRLMYGDRDDPYRALARLAQRLESTLEPPAIPTAIVESVAEALRLPYVALEIGPTDAIELTTSHGEPVGEPLSLPLVYGAEPVGRLLIARRAPGEEFSASDMRLLSDLARGAGAAVHSVRLTLDVIRSRERLVAAREEERRRIRRDLHDGLGPTLAAIGMRAELAADMAGRDPAAASEVLSELTSEVGGALAEVRRLVEGLRPPALDELGLIGAIGMQAERLGQPPQFDVSADGTLPELPAAVEVAAYRIAVEAMTNAARHAAADHCRVRVGVDGERRPSLRVEVTDDGQGMPAQVRPGIGLTSMRERAAEVGGSFEIGPGSDPGTRVVARLPLHPTTAATAAP